MNKDQMAVSWETMVSIRDEAHRLERKKVIREVLEIINAFEKKPVRCKDSVYIIKNDELWNAIKLHLTTEIMKLRGDKE